MLDVLGMLLGLIGVINRGVTWTERSIGAFSWGILQGMEYGWRPGNECRNSAVAPTLLVAVRVVSWGIGWWMSLTVWHICGLCLHLAAFDCMLGLKGLQ